jgi:AraC-like DNA-binding protein
MARPGAAMSTLPINQDRAPNAAILLSSDAFDARDRFDAWREEIMLRVARVDVGVPDRTRFHTRLRVIQLPNLSIIDRRSTPSVVKRTPVLVRDGDDALMVSLPWRGSLELRIGGEARAGPGEAILSSLHEVGDLISPNPFAGASLRLDRTIARSVIPGFETRLNMRIPLDPGASALLRSYLKGLASTAGGLTQSAAALADMHVRELLGHLFDPVGELARAEPYGGIKAARLRAVINDIAARFADPRLNPAGVGRRLGLSERYVQQLLEGAGLSFTTYVRELRLKRARQLLRDPLTRHLRVGDIAAMAGFTDLSHFNHMFRQRFGESPTDARRRR